jgi:hypothetical protein
MSQDDSELNNNREQAKKFIPRVSNETTFLVTMSNKRLCACLSDEGFCNLNERCRCGGETLDRPEWCSLIEYVDVIEVLGKVIRDTEKIKRRT